MKKMFKVIVGVTAAACGAAVLILRLKRQEELDEVGI